MVRRASCSRGDVFEVKTKKGFRYFQLVDKDKPSLNSDVIAVFDGEFSKKKSPDFAVKSNVDFFALTLVNEGIEEYWVKVGNTDVVDISTAIFKDVDYEKDPRQPSEGSSDHWKIRSVNTNWEYVGKERNVPKNAELGLIFNPESIYRRIASGGYGQTYFGHTY
jgi:hypothetical protein